MSALIKLDSSTQQFRPCVIVPSYNHIHGIEPLLSYLDDLKIPAVIVDDGSASDIGRALDELVARYPLAHLIRHDDNAGKGAAVKTGLLWAHEHGFTHAVQIDADGQHDIRDLTCLLTKAASSPHSLISGRPIFDSSAPKVRAWGRYLSIWLVWLELGSTDLADPLCGFRVYPVGVTVETLACTKVADRMDFDPEIAVRLAWAGVPMISVDTHVIYPPGNSSNFKYGRDNVRMVKLHTRLLTQAFVRLIRRTPS